MPMASMASMASMPSMPSERPVKATARPLHHARRKWRGPLCATASGGIHGSFPSVARARHASVTDGARHGSTFSRNAPQAPVERCANAVLR
ncbi:hypothetical protein B0G69_5316 [Paraburkholderia sp. RAU2J]|nr:hypothetical protein B0G69_5316 [Paraburkholderia sp. RAU2J]